MASSPVKFFSVFLVVSVAGWVVFTFASRLLAWFLSRILSASVGFRVAGCNCFRDVTIKFRKGSIESVSVGEIKLSFRKSLIKLGFGVISKDPKLQLLIFDFEVVMRPEQNKKTGKSQKIRSTGKGKWLVITSMARFLSLSVTDLVVKMPKAVLDVKDLKMDIFKIAGPNQLLGVKLHLVPFTILFGDSALSLDQTYNDNQRDGLQSDQAFPALAEKISAHFLCDDLLVVCDFGHEKEKGVKITNLDLTSGKIMVNFDESFIYKSSGKPETCSNDGIIEDALLNIAASKKSPESKSSLLTIKKKTSAIPEKVSFSVPKLDVNFIPLDEGLVMKNNVTGIRLSSIKTQSHDDSEEAASHFDVQLDLSEIHLLREGATSVLEIQKVAASASLDVPVEPLLPIKAGVDAKLGGTHFDLIMGRLMPLMHLHLAKRKRKKSVKENTHQEVSLSKEAKSIMWTCTVSAPEMTIILYSLNGLAIYNGSSQFSHLFANNISGKGIQVYTELGELQLHMEDEHNDITKENVFGVDSYSGSLMHIAKVSFDWGNREMESQEKPEGPQPNRWALAFSIDVSGMGVQFGFKHVQSIMFNLMSYRTLFRGLSFSDKRSTHKNVDQITKKTSKGIQILNLNMEKFSISYCGDTIVEDAVIADAKRVNFGSQGGEVVISVPVDGTPRRAGITSMLPGTCKNLKFSTSVVISQLSMCINKGKKSTQIELERAKSIYQEYPENHQAGVEVTLFDLHNAKIVRRSGGLADFAVCSLFSATDITVRWEPDVHLALYESITRLKCLFGDAKLQISDEDVKIESVELNKTEMERKVTADQVESGQQHDKKESIFAVDVEMLRISAELADGVEAKIYVQSIFTENAAIGVLLEGLMLSLNDARVLISSRMQISCIPVLTGRLLDPKAELAAKRDWVIQGLDVHICMPLRLPLRAIQDAIEDMIRGLKLALAAKTNLIVPVEKRNLKKTKASHAAKLGSVRFVIRKLTAEIEEEPIQGWLDEHYHLMRKEVCELSVRLKFLDDVISAANKGLGSVDPSDIGFERKTHCDAIEVDIHDKAAAEKLREEIHRQIFRSYYLACQKMVFAEGSGACSKGFQAGFKPSTRRASLLSLCVTELDATSIKIDGGAFEMVQFIKALDPVCLEKNIPFSRLYGRDINVHAGSLVIQLRDYTLPLFSAASGKCEGRIVFAQQATCFQPQIHQDVFIGRWHKVRMLRSASGTTPPMKMYSKLPIYFQKGEVSFGVGYEPAFADISYAFTVALRKANLSRRKCNLSSKDQTSFSENQQPKKERSLPWWDDMRYFIHGEIVLYFGECSWSLLGTTNPYDDIDKLQIVSGSMDIQQTDGRVDVSAKEFKMYISSLESLMKNCSLKVPTGVTRPFIYAPAFSLEVVIDWGCESGNPLNHYLHALPIEGGEPRKKVFDPFRSTSLSLRWNFSLRPLEMHSEKDAASSCYGDTVLLDETIFDISQKFLNVAFPTMNLGAHDLAWVFKWWSLNYSPPHKLRSFSRWPRFGIPRVARSGNLSLDKVMTEFCLRVDSTPSCIRHMPLGDDDPAAGLTFKMSKLKHELCYSRGKQKYTFDCKRESLDLVYRGLDLHMLKVYLDRDSNSSAKGSSHNMPIGRVANERCNTTSTDSEKQRDDGFLLYSDYFTIRRQAPKADPARLLAWQEAGRKNLEMTYVRSEFENGSESDHTRSDPSDDDGFNVVIADNCQRVFVYGLKFLWTLENRDAVWSWVGGLSKVFEPPKPSPSRQYAQRKMMEEKQKIDALNVTQEDSAASTSHSMSSPVAQQVEALGSHSSPSPTKTNSILPEVSSKHGHKDDLEEEGTRHFMVNVVQPQFNLQSEEANGRFLLAAASGRVLARSFHSVLHVGYELIEQALGASNLQTTESGPEMTWKRFQLSVMLEHVQAHVAPTDVDPGAGLQWLPKILRSSQKLKRTGALLERVFMPCQMYFRYTRHKGGTAELKVKPLKELSFNSPNITATMTSRQFQVMLDVLSNLLFARLPKPRKNSLLYPSEDDDDDVEEEADEVVPDGVEEVELAKINLEQRERERKLLLDDIRSLLEIGDSHTDLCLSPEKGGYFWMVNDEKTALVQALAKELVNVQKSRKAASSALRKALQKAAHLRLMEKEKNKSPSCAMRISMRINMVVWSMLADGKTFAETEINDMIYDFDRDYKDIGVSRFTTKSFVVRNCLPNAKSDMLLSAWNAPPEWGKNVMLRVDAKQGAPKDGSSPLELFQVEIYPLKIYLTETMYRMMWDYFFPEEEQDSQRRQEVWRVSTSAGSRKLRKNFTGSEEATSSSHSTRESDIAIRLNASAATPANGRTRQTSSHCDTSQVSKLQSLKANIVCGSNPELRRTSSFDDKTWEENMAEIEGNDVALQPHSSNSYAKSAPLNPTVEHPAEISKNKSKDSKPIKSSRSSHEEKKLGKSQDEKRGSAWKLMEFHNIKIGQVELQVTYEGLRFAVNDLRLLMDTFHRVEFIGTWRRLFSRVKNHIIWGVLKSVTGMQGKKFKDKAQNQTEGLGSAVLGSDLNFSDSDGGQPGKSDQFPISWLKRPSDGAGDGFVTSIRGLFNSQRRKAKAFVLRTMRDESSESDGEYSPFARQLTITNKAKKIIRRHTKKLRSGGQKSSGLTLQQESVPSTPRETTPFQSDSSGASSPYEDVTE